MPRASTSGKRVSSLLPETIQIKWYGPRGSRKASTAKSFAVTPPGARNAIKLEIPTSSRRSIASREKYVLEVLAVYAKEVAKRKRAAARRKAAREEEARLEALATARRKRAAAKKRAEAQARKRVIEEVREEIEVETKPLPKTIKKKLIKKKETSPLRQLQKEVLAAAGIREIGALVPKLEELEVRHPPTTYDESLNLVGGPLKKKNRDSKLGTEDYVQKQFTVIKRTVDFPLDKAIFVYPQSVEAAALTVREYLKPIAQKFVAEMRGKTKEAYILRIKTEEYMEGGIGKAEGVGLPRTYLTNQMPENKYQVASLREQYPHLSDSEIVARMQERQMSDMMDQLFNNFTKKYATYMSTKFLEGMAITGFNIEVVEKINGEAVR
jgi:hypothetical protein